MYDRWVEKEQLLKHFYEHGQFPSPQAEDEPSTEAEQGQAQETYRRIEKPRPVQLNHAYVFFVNALWILSSMLHLAIFRWARASLFE